MTYIVWRQSPETGRVHAYEPGKYFSLCLRGVLPADGECIVGGELCEQCRRLWDGEEK